MESGFSVHGIRKWNAQPREYSSAKLRHQVSSPGAVLSAFPTNPAMSDITDTAIRYLALLRTIPRFPKKATAKEIHARLVASGYRIDLRSVQRDLQRLSKPFAFTSDEGVRPAGWYWPKDAPDLLAPELGVDEALQLELLTKYLKPIIPAGSWDALQPRVKAAQAALDMLGSTALKRWRMGVAVLDDGPPLLAPEVSPEVISTVHESLLQGRRFSVSYRSHGAEASNRFEVNPVALVYVGQVGYLVATIRDYKDLRHLALHRMWAPVPSSTRAQPPDGFDLQTHLREHAAFDLPGEKRLRLKLRVSSWLARHLDERPLSADQLISPVGADPDEFIVRAVVRESERLIWWLRSHGDALEVLQPAALRKRLAREFSVLAGRYGSG